MTSHLFRLLILSTVICSFQGPNRMLILLNLLLSLFCLFLYQSKLNNFPGIILDCSLILYGNTNDCCILILFPETLLNLLVLIGIFNGCIRIFYIWKITPIENSFTSSFQSGCFLFLFLAMGQHLVFTEWCIMLSVDFNSKNEEGNFYFSFSDDFQMKVCQVL